jgi:hypothetical protein
MCYFLPHFSKYTLLKKPLLFYFFIVNGLINFAVTKNYATELRQKKAIFKNITKTKKAVFTTLLTTYPTLKNNYYLEEIDNEITMDKLFEPLKN